MKSSPKMKHFLKYNINTTQCNSTHMNVCLCTVQEVCHLSSTKCDTTICNMCEQSDTTMKMEGHNINGRT